MQIDLKDQGEKKLGGPWVGSWMGQGYLPEGQVK
jgi:hypothetical protein